MVTSSEALPSMLRCQVWFQKAGTLAQSMYDILVEMVAENCFQGQPEYVGSYGLTSISESSLSYTPFLTVVKHQ
jgi:hypothetical protein